MTLEDRLRAYAAKGELVHISLAFRASDGLFHANFAAASPPAGYARGAHADPVEALEAAFKSTPVKPPRSSHKPQKITAAVTEPEAKADGLNENWTAP